MQTDSVSGRPTTERVGSIFSSIAHCYDAFNVMASLGIDRGWRRKLVRTARLTPDSRVLDLAAGTGDVAFALANIGRPAEVVATDLNAEMLAIAQQKALERPPAVPVSFSIADAQKLPFEDDSFDVVTVAFGVRNFPNREANFREVLRVLRPGGRYVVLEFSRPPFAPLRGIYHAYLRYVIPMIGGALTGDRSGFVYLNVSIRQFPVQVELAAEMRQAGFATAGWENRCGGIVALHTAVK